MVHQEVPPRKKRALRSELSSHKAKCVIENRKEVSNPSLFDDTWSDCAKGSFKEMRRIDCKLQRFLALEIGLRLGLAKWRRNWLSIQMVSILCCWVHGAAMTVKAAKGFLCDASAMHEVLDDAT